jgi:hypothetical protein
LAAPLLNQPEDVVMTSATRSFSILTLVIAASLLASTQAMAADAMGEMTFINQGDVKWGDAPPVLPKGAKIAVLYGDPFKSGPYVVRLKMPAGYKVAPHWHSQAENLTVISGAFNIGSGDTVDKAHAHLMNAGGFHYLPAKGHHYAYTNAPTVLQIHGEGPFDINYINPDDDPQKAKK